jgi:hypothetical protein
VALARRASAHAEVAPVNPDISSGAIGDLPTILWEEILKRFPPIEVVEKPKRAYSNLIHGITEMKVRIPA